MTKLLRTCLPFLLLLPILLLGYQSSIHLLLRRNVENSDFLTWCQTSTVKRIEYAHAYNTDLWGATPFSYALSEEEETAMVELLNEVEDYDISIEKQAPTDGKREFQLYVIANRKAYLFEFYGREVPIYIVSESKEDVSAYAIGDYRHLLLRCPALYDFAKPLVPEQPPEA